MRKQLLLAIATHLRQALPELAHIDVWNANLATIQGESAWPVPSVFIEFEQYQVRQLANHAYMADVPIVLHVITRSRTARRGIDDAHFAEMLDWFDLIDRIHLAMSTLHGDTFTTPMLTDSITKHNHAELIESCERYVTQVRHLGSHRHSGDHRLDIDPKVIIQRV